MQVNKTSLFIEQYYIMSTHQANMFKLVLQSEDGKERIMMVKRVVPKELPAKTGDRIIVIIIVVAVFMVDISLPT